MSRSGSEPVPSSDTRSPTPPLEPQWQWRSFPNPTTNIPRTNDPDQTQEEHAQIQAPESAAEIHAEQAPRPEYERAHAQEPAPESEPAQQEVVDKHQDEVKRVLLELLSESSESPNHMLSQEGPKQSQDPAPESPDHMSSHEGPKQSQEPAPAQSPEQSHQQASMQGIARGQEYVHIAPENLPDVDDDIDNQIVLRVQDISEDSYYEINTIIRRRLGAIIPQAATRHQFWMIETTQENWQRMCPDSANTYELRVRLQENGDFFRIRSQHQDGSPYTQHIKGKGKGKSRPPRTSPSTYSARGAPHMPAREYSREHAREPFDRDYSPDRMRGRTREYTREPLRERAHESSRDVVRERPRGHDRAAAQEFEREYVKEPISEHAVEAA